MDAPIIGIIENKQLFVRIFFCIRKYLCIFQSFHTFFFAKKTSRRTSLLVTYPAIGGMNFLFLELLCQIGSQNVKFFCSFVNLFIQFSRFVVQLGVKFHRQSMQFRLEIYIKILIYFKLISRKKKRFRNEMYAFYMSVKIEK